MIRLGVVSFLNATPLIDGLAGRSDVTLVADVPARLPGLLDAGRVDAALVPIVDVLRSAGRYRVVSDACIGCDGETMTVRIFSQTPPDRIARVFADTDSHTSVALARVLFRELYDRELEVVPLETRNAEVRTQNAEETRSAGREPVSPSAFLLQRSDFRSDLDAILLIGDKVVDCGRAGFAYEIDLGGAWRAHTGLPFVFAVWAVKNDEWRMANGEKTTDDEAAPPVSTPGIRHSALAPLLRDARDRGLARAAAIARERGSAHGWPVELAVRYLTRCLTYRLDARHIEGANLFARLCGRFGIVPEGADMAWPDDLCARRVAT